MFGLIVTLIIGAVFCFIGWRIWKNEQITLIHDYHYKKVSENDRKAYTEMIGKACIIIGLGIILTGVIDYMSSTIYGWICFGICFVTGFTIMVKAQKKYNGGIF